MLQHLIHNSFFNADLIAGIIFLAMGTLIRAFPPTSMKGIFGYRTLLSTRNADTWKEANRFAAGFSIRLGLMLIPFGLVIGILFKLQNQAFYMITVATVAVAALLLLGNTEWHLSQTFDDEGNRKSPS